MSAASVTRRRALQAGGAAALIAPLAAAGYGWGGGTGGTSRNTSLVFTYLGTAAQQKQWNRLFAEFSRLHPEITLSPQVIAGDNWTTFFNTLATRIAGGNIPDVIQVATEGQRLLAAKDIFEPLDEYIARDRAVIDAYYADLSPNLIAWNREYASPGGHTYYLPGEFNTVAMWCNRRLFDRAGVDLPDGAWTWDDFESACRRIRSRTGAYAYAAGAAYFPSIEPWLLTNGTSTLNRDWSHGTYASDAAVEAAAFNRRLVVDRLAPPIGAANSYNATAEFTQDRLAMFGGGRWPVIDIRNADFVAGTAIVPFPKKLRQGSPVGSNGYPILRASRRKDDAWKFIKFLISERGSSFFAQLGGTIVPARRSVAEGRTYLQDSPAGTPELYRAVSYGSLLPSPDNSGQTQKAIENGWQQMLTGNVTPEKALRDANRTLESYL